MARGKHLPKVFIGGGLFLFAVFGLAYHLQSLRKAVVLREFAWRIQDDTAPFSFEIVNPNLREADVIVVVSAQSYTNTKYQPSVRDVGREVLEVSLKPKEKRRITGQVHLLRSIGDIALYPLVTDKRPN